MFKIAFLINVTRKNRTIERDFITENRSKKFNYLETFAEQQKILVICLKELNY